MANIPMLANISLLIQEIKDGCVFWKFNEGYNQRQRKKIYFFFLKGWKRMYYAGPLLYT